MESIDPASQPTWSQPFYLAATFEARRFGNHDAIANAFDEIWNEIDGHLDAMLGTLMVNGLFWRSVAIASESHPWLKAIRNAVFGPKNLPAYRAKIAEMHLSEAVSASAAILREFEKLLVSLVGHSLSDHLIVGILKRVLRRWATG
jgi:hypothetical protein